LENLLLKHEEFNPGHTVRVACLFDEKALPLKSEVGHTVTLFPASMCMLSLWMRAPRMPWLVVLANILRKDTAVALAKTCQPAGW
jgi:hypothetical protein